MTFDFEVTDEQPVATISLGYQSSQSQGAANQTLLYIDNIRLLSSNENATGIRENVKTENSHHTVYDLQGRTVNGSPRKGVYVKNARKIVVK